MEHVVVWEADDGHAVVETIDPMQTIAASDARLGPIADEVRRKLANVLDRLV